MRVRREVLLLVALVVFVDLAFIGVYFGLDVRSASDPVKLGFTAVWTLVTLGVVFQGLTRVRKARLERSSRPPL